MKDLELPQGIRGRPKQGHDNKVNFLQGLVDRQENLTSNVMDPTDLRQWQKEVVTTKLLPKRLGVDSSPLTEDDYESDASDEGADSADSSSLTGKIDTQPFHQEQQSSAERARKIRRKRIPPVSETINAANYLEDVDMYTRSLSLPLCRVTQIWKLRETKRGLNNSRYPKKHLPIDANSQWINISYPPLEDDGPMACCYKLVLSMDVEQLEDPTTDRWALRQVQGKRNDRRVRIFFYNNYAKAVGAWLDGVQKQIRYRNTTNVLVKLDSIPAISIFPFVAGTELPLSNNLAYCLCVGDDSSLQIPTDDGGRMRLRLDHPMGTDTEPMEVRFGMVGNSDEFVLSSVNFGLVDTGARFLQLAFENWREKQEALERQRRDEMELIVVSARKDSTVPQQQEAGKARNQRLVEAPPADPTVTQRLDAPPLPQKRIDSDSYVPLFDLENIIEKGQKVTVNVYGVVIGFQIPRLTRKRTSFFMNVSLIDDSMSPPEEGAVYKPVPVQIFVSSRELAPNLQQVGDVLRLRRITAGWYRDHIQLTFHEKGSAFLVLRKHEGDLSVVSPNNKYTYSQQDRSRTNRLWDWGQNWLKFYSTTDPEHSVPLEQIKPCRQYGRDDTKEGESDLDVVGMVSAIYGVAANQERETGRGFLRLWDGTGTGPPDPFGRIPQLLHDGTQVQQAEPTQEVLQKLNRIVEGMGVEGLAAPAGLVGRFVNVLIWEEHTWKYVRRCLKPGSFIRLRSVSDRYQSLAGVRCLQVYESSWISLLPDTCLDVRRILEHNQKRVAAEGVVWPNSAFLSLDLPEKQMSNASTTLSQFVADRKLQTWEGHVRIVQVTPSIEKNLKSLCYRKSNGDFDYFFVLTVKDETDQVSVIAKGSIGLSIFGVSANDIVNKNAWKGRTTLHEGALWWAKLHKKSDDDQVFFLFEALEPL